MGKGKGKEDALEGAATIGAAAIAVVNPVAGIAAAALPTFLKAAVRKFENRRTAKMFTRMVETDEAPEEFAAHVRDRIKQGHDGTLAALRLLVTASLEAVATAAIEPLALVGRQHLREEAPAWVARGWVRFLTELDEGEVGELSRLVEAGRVAMTHPMGTRGVVGFKLVYHSSGELWHLRLDNVVDARNPGPIADGRAQRFVELFVQNHLARLDEREERGLTRAAFQRHDRRQEMLRVDPVAFRVIARAFLPETPTPSSK